MLVPQSMAYALLAGLPPQVGLYASILPLVLYGLFGTSRTLAVGPVAIVSLLVATGLGPLAGGDVALYVRLALTLALLTGLIQALLGLLRLGFVVNFMSHPVLSGFTSAAALVIGFSQAQTPAGAADAPAGLLRSWSVTPPPISARRIRRRWPWARAASPCWLSPGSGWGRGCSGAACRGGWPCP